MRPRYTELTAELLREYLSYNPDTGVFVWIKPRCKVTVGKIAGSLTHGYLAIGVFGKLYKAHRLAWLYHYGEWPKDKIDHINGDKADNRIENLRDVSHLVNMQNRRTMRKGNLTGFYGVTKNRHRFHAQITAEGKKIFLGLFDTPEEAAAAYITAKRKYHLGNTL